MSAAGIVLLLGGIAVFIASFVLPEKKLEATEQERKVNEELAKKSVEQELVSARVQLQDTVDETVSYAMEKTERTLERISNEKMQAVNDYSDTVLSEIHKNHEEVVFLYDMLNNKQQALQDTVKEADKKMQELLKEKIHPEKTVKKEALKEKEPKKTVEKQSEREKEKTDFQPINVWKTEHINPVKDVEIVVGEGRANNNEKILALHKEGKSNMAIARELGLGVGEVKLVIDLFKKM